MTQFVLDVVGNPASVLHEVNRVLQPGGLWINDGIPCHFHDEPASPDARDGDRWPEHLRAFGFEPVEVARRMSPHLEASRGKWSQRVTHPVVHSVGRKTASLATEGQPARLRRTSAARSPTFAAASHRSRRGARSGA